MKVDTSDFEKKMEFRSELMIEFGENYFIGKNVNDFLEHYMRGEGIPDEEKAKHLQNALALKQQKSSFSLTKNAYMFVNSQKLSRLCNQNISDVLGNGLTEFVADVIDCDLLPKECLKYVQFMHYVLGDNMYKFVGQLLITLHGKIARQKAIILKGSYRKGKTSLANAVLYALDGTTIDVNSYEPNFKLAEAIGHLFVVFDDVDRLGMSHLSKKSHFFDGGMIQLEKKYAVPGKYFWPATIITTNEVDIPEKLKTRSTVFHLCQDLRPRDIDLLGKLREENYKDCFWYMLYALYYLKPEKYSDMEYYDFSSFFESKFENARR